MTEQPPENEQPREEDTGADTPPAEIPGEPEAPVTPTADAPAEEAVTPAAPQSGAETPARGAEAPSEG